MSHPANTDGDNPFAPFFAEAEQSPSYWVKLAKLEFTEEVLGCLKDLGMSKSQLADRLGVSPAMVTRLVNGNNNFELATMVKIARALGCEFRSHLQRPGTQTLWDFLTEEPEESPTEKPEEQMDWKSEERQTLEALFVLS